MGQTLKRDNSEAADAEADIEAVPADEMDEATFYTNIDPAKARKLKEVPMEQKVLEHIVVDKDLDLSELTEEDATFSAELFLADGTIIPGTFTCDADPACTPVTAATALVLGRTVLTGPPNAEEWEFESDGNPTIANKPDADYMYFGYWLKSPVGDSSTDYAFATYSGGNADNFTDNNGH